MSTAAPPLGFRLARWMMRAGVPGGFRLQEAMRRGGLLARPAVYDLGGGVEFEVPVGRRENSWDAADLARYDPPLIEGMLRAAQAMPAPPVLVDAGADIGTVSAQTVAGGAKLARILAYEPNAAAFAVLSRNLARLDIPAEARRAGVGSQAGHGALRQPDFSGNAHSAFVGSGDDFPVEPIDDLGISGPVILKLDVEGGELAALRGATATLRQAPAAAVVFEAHIRQAERIGEDPSVILRWLLDLRPWSFEVLDVPGLVPDPDRPFFAQIENPRPIGYNVLALTL